MAAHDADRFDVAVIGIALRFPGASTVDEFWNNLVNAKESVQRFTEDELLSRGLSKHRLQQTGFVRARPVIDHIDEFAAEFFHYSPREAALLDPQHRLFLECAWHAFEDAGYAPRRVPGRVAAYAGCGLSSYLLFNLLSSDAVTEGDDFQVMLGSDKDFLATRVAYKLNLRGPAVTIQTGCSSSLVALSMAVHSLLTLQCDVALAGGVALQVPQRTGYIYEPGGISSPDGHCHPFSADANGTVFGDGVGAVILKRVNDAIRDHDSIYACIRGCAINNDGSEKIGYTAPSVSGQIEVIRQAQGLAMVSADQIGYVEGHGTATELGDFAEIAALTKAFKTTTDKKGFCALGSVKGNIGHLDAAAGIAGFIKTTLMLHNRQLVPSVNCDAPNQAILSDDSPFYVNTKALRWTHPSGVLRAGVSSFGIGGTNAHVILEEAPQVEVLGQERTVQIITASASTQRALVQMVDELRQSQVGSTSSLEDVAYTLHVGRESFPFRRAIVCDDRASAIDAGMASESGGAVSNNGNIEPRSVCFLYPGGGCQYPLMAHELYKTESTFRRTIDECAILIREELGLDLRESLYPPRRDAKARAAMANPRTGLIGLFVTEYALSNLLGSWGIVPAAMLGHSVGEYTAACVSGVISLADALKLVLKRGELFASLPAGAMIAVPLSEDEVVSYQFEGVYIAAVNHASNCVLSGSRPAISRCINVLKRQRVEYRNLHVEVAAHSGLVEEIVEPFYEVLSTVKLSAPKIPFVSNVSGDYISEVEAKTPAYWCRQLRNTVRFAEGIRTLQANPAHLFVEVGPGRTLGSFASSPNAIRQSQVVCTLPHAQDVTDERTVLQLAVAKLWTAGVKIEWERYHSLPHQRVHLPGYPFGAERARHWISPKVDVKEKAPKDKPSAQFYLPSWRQSGCITLQGRNVEEQSVWIILGGEVKFATALLNELAGRSMGPVICVPMRSKFSAEASFENATNTQSVEFYRGLLNQIEGDPNTKRYKLVYLGETVNVDCRQDTSNGDPASTIVNLTALTQALMQRGACTDVIIVSQNATQMSCYERVNLRRSILQAMAIAIPQECQSITSMLIDFDENDLAEDHLARTCAAVASEALNRDPEPIVAYRGPQRWVRSFSKVAFPYEVAESRSCRPGVYVLLGGTGKLGLTVARAFASPSTTIVIASRTPYEAETRSKDVDGQVSRWTTMATELEKTGCKAAHYCVDVADERAMGEMLFDVNKRFGRIIGVVHMAGETGEFALKLMSDLTPEECQRQLRAKVNGCIALERALVAHKPEFCVLFSSTASIVGGIGMLAYAAANCFMDSFAVAKSTSRTRWLSINWEGWITSGRSSVADVKSELDSYAIAPGEAVSALEAMIYHKVAGQVVVTSRELEHSMACRRGTSESTKANRPQHRGEICILDNYIAPSSTLERVIAEIWRDVLGLDKVGIKDNLFELGGNSLLGLRILSRVRSQFDKNLPVSALYEAPTIQAFAQLVEGRSATTERDGSVRGANRRKVQGQRRGNQVSLNER